MTNAPKKLENLYLAVTVVRRAPPSIEMDKEPLYKWEVSSI